MENSISRGTSYRLTSGWSYLPRSGIFKRSIHSGTNKSPSHVPEKHILASRRIKPSIRKAYFPTPIVRYEVERRHLTPYWSSLREVSRMWVRWVLFAWPRSSRYFTEVNQVLASLQWALPDRLASETSLATSLILYACHRTSFYRDQSLGIYYPTLAPCTFRLVTAQNAS